MICIPDSPIDDDRVSCDARSKLLNVLMQGFPKFDAAKPEAGKLYFTEAEWDAFVLGVKDGEFDLDEDGNLPPLPESQHQN